ncbi:MAG: GGDEF domain-containing protein [Aquabacterium sp.]
MTGLLERFIISSTPAWRVLLAVFAATPFFLITLAGHGWALATPEIRNGVNLGVVIGLQCLLIAVVISQIGVGLYLWPRRQMPDPVPNATLLTCLGIGCYYTVVTIVVGTFTTGVDLVLLGVLAIGLLLFERRPMLISYVVCMTMLALHDLGVITGQWAYAPALTPRVFEDGHPVWWFNVWRQFVFLAGSFVMFGLLMLLFARLDAITAKLSRLSFTDGLTGLANRRRFMEVLNDEVAREARAGQPLCLVLMDADHFKQVNDRHGHLAGDEVLRALGRLMLGCVRSPTDLPCRLGGEEFALILPDTRGEQALTVCARLREQLALEVFGDVGQPFKVTVSMGVVQSDGLSAEKLLQQADQQLYRAKSMGRDRVCVAGAPSEGRA